MIESWFKNVLSISLILTSNLVFMKYLNNDDFLILLFDIQDADINFNTMKTTKKIDGDDNQCFWFKQLDWSI